MQFAFEGINVGINLVISPGVSLLKLPFVNLWDRFSSDRHSEVPSLLLLLVPALLGRFVLL